MADRTESVVVGCLIQDALASSLAGDWTQDTMISSHNPKNELHLINGSSSPRALSTTARSEISTESLQLQSSLPIIQRKRPNVQSMDAPFEWQELGQHRAGSKPPSDERIPEQVLFQNITYSPRLQHSPRTPAAVSDDSGYHSRSASSADFRPQMRSRSEIPSASIPKHSGTSAALLGHLTASCSEHEPTWRNNLCLSDFPWLQDHRFQNCIVFPEAGMISLAVEAVRRVAEPSKEVEGFRLRDILFDLPMTIPSTNSLPTLVSLRPWRTGSKETQFAWYEFSISSRQKKGRWTQHCVGLVSIKYKPGPKQGWQNTHAEMVAWHREEYHKLRRSSLRRSNLKEYYASLVKQGLVLGTTFRNLTSVEVQPSAALCSIGIPDPDSTSLDYPEVIHPATLDSIFQMLFSSSRTRTDCKYITPKSVDSIYISAVIPKQPNQRLYSYCRPNLLDISKGSLGDLFLSTEKWSELLLSIEGFNAADISSEANPPTSPSEKSSRKHTASTVWDLDINSLSGKELTALLQPLSLAEPEVDSRIICELEFASYIICKRVLRKYSPAEAIKLPMPLQHFYNYLLRQVELGISSALPCQQPGWQNTDTQAEDEILNRVESESVDGKLLIQVMKYFDDVFQGREDASKLLTNDFSKNNLSDYSRTAIGARRCNPVLCEYLKLLSHKRRLRILELGSGMGETTNSILRSMGSYEETACRVESYTFTDSSCDFFEAAGEKLSEWAPLMEFKQLHVEHDLGEQGFDMNSYDVIVARNYFRSATSINHALSNCRRLLKPGGALILDEATSSLSRLTMTFGVLPEWWKGIPEGRILGPNWSEATWDSQLRGQGFGGLHACFRDNSRDLWLNSLMVSIAGPAISPSLPSEVVIVRQGQAKGPAKYLRSVLSELMDSESSNIIEIDLSDIWKYDLRGKYCISALEIGKPFLCSIEPQQLEDVKYMLLESAGTLWLTRGAAYDAEYPEMNLILGLARSIRTEKPNVRLSILDRDPTHLLESSSTADTILRILRSMNDADNTEWEYAERGGFLSVPRLYPEKKLSQVLELTETKPPTKGHYWQPNQALALNMRMTGRSKTLQWVVDEDDRLPLGDDEVEFEVKAAGLSPRDPLVANGKLQPDGEELGLECSGTVTRVGKNVRRFVRGDRVMTLRPGCFRTFIRSKEALVLRIPDRMSFEEASSTYAAYTTAIYSLCHVARIQNGETILIHSAAGGVGQAAIVVAKNLGAEIFVTVGSPEKKKLLVDTYGIREDHVFDSGSEDFDQGIKRMTGGKGVDVALNSLEGDALRQTWSCVAPFGRFIELGYGNIETNAGLDMGPFLRNKLFASVDLISICRLNEKLAAKLLADVSEYYTQELVKPARPLSKLRFSQVEEALRRSNPVGKIVLTAEDDDMVPIAAPRHQPISLSGDATYVLAGNLGHLGRSLVLWMVERGAKNLVIISHLGATTLETEQLNSCLSSASVNIVIFQCDICDKRVLQNTIAEATQELPPIRGLINFSMHSEGILFEEMTCDQFHLGVGSKFRGIRNLHNILPKELDFFICLSSIQGVIGSRGQGTYNAGHTCQDALVHRRRIQGLRGHSIALGEITGLEFASEFAAVETTGAAISITETELHLVLESAMRDEIGAHPVIGLPVGGRTEERTMC